MTKKDAIAIFGSIKALADAVEVTRQAISLWPDQLDRAREDRVIGAAKRLGKRVPKPQAA